MITSSPGFSVAISALKSTCLPPVETMISVGLVGEAVLAGELGRRSPGVSSGMPSGAVYRVSPRSIAAFAASRMFAGVSKSGSPAPSDDDVAARGLQLPAQRGDGDGGRGLDARERVGEEGHGGSVCGWARGGVLGSRRPGRASRRGASGRVTRGAASASAAAAADAQLAAGHPGDGPDPRRASPTRELAHARAGRTSTHTSRSCRKTTTICTLGSPGRDECARTAIGIVARIARSVTGLR